MKLAGFTFTRILAEKNANKLEDLKINSGINIESIEEIETKNIKSQDTFLLVKWNYEVNYNPEIAKISLGGNAILSMESKKAKDILNEWKNKKIDPEFNIVLLNIILKKASIKSLQLEDDFNLPPHFKLPSLKLKSE